MKPQSAKAKGRKLQQMTRDMILKTFPELTSDDVRSTSMGAGGEDVQLSQAARKFLPIQIECKNKAKIAVHTWYHQAEEHGKQEPILVIKQDHDIPLVLMDAEFFFLLMRKINGSF